MPQNNPLTPQPTELMDKPASILKQMLSSDFLCAMMYLAKYDDKDLYIEVVKKCQKIEALLKTSSQVFYFYRGNSKKIVQFGS